MFCVYKFTSPSGKSYIGQTNNILRRLREHQHPASRCSAFKNAIQKYGWENFSFEILVESLSQDEANDLEIQYIQQFNTISPNGYNLDSGGKQKLPSEETIQKIIESKRNSPYHPSEETKAQISQKLKGRIPHNKGKKMSQETCNKRKGRVPVNKGIPMSEEQRQKLSESNNYRKRPVSIDGAIFSSVKDVCVTLRIHRSTVKNRLDSPHWNWNYITITEDAL